MLELSEKGALGSADLARIAAADDGEVDRELFRKIDLGGVDGADARVRTRSYGMNMIRLRFLLSATAFAAAMPLQAQVTATARNWCQTCEPMVTPSA